MNTDGNIDAIDRHLADCEEHDAWQDLQDQLEAARADAKEAEAYAEELEAKLAKAIDLLHRHCDPWGMNDFDATTLAEIKGESHD